ncbi:hypothetical protein ARMSODRAFT_1027709 [Armillaria solidipes]|uniref:Uncharacterized protein n=1 Tax=Armillaria solidipes TaxID=1076256 RepID=A0A2H3AJM0_9AGAR|nr:hypothetical protein ARMSODRAFT_1027709 [Armillaria solidipes]
MDIPPNDISTDRSPVKQPQSASTKHELESSVCEPKRLSPRGSMEAKFQSIKTLAPIQVEEGTPLKKSESPALLRGEPSCQQASAAQDIKNHSLENSSRDQMKAKSFLSRAPASFDFDSRQSALQQDTLGRSHRSLSSAPFQHVRHRSEHPIFNDKKIFNYHPVSRSETDVMLSIFQRFERLVARNLLTTQLGLDSNVQKTSLQSIPRPHKFHGDPDIIEFDNWLFSVIRWMKIANICDPVYHTDSSGTQQVSDIDVQRTNTLATFLDSDARTWYNNSVEDCNGNVEDDFPTFMQVVNGLFRRFIHESSLYDVVQYFKSVTYASAGGVRQLFTDLTRFANIMPSPSDVYSFRHQLLISIPTRIRREITREGITAEASTVDQIMQQALIVERGSKAEQYYSPQHSRYAQTLENRHGTPDTKSEYSSGTQDSASDHESDCLTGTSSSTDPTKSDTEETTETHADTQDSTNSEDSDDSTRQFRSSDLLEAPIEWDLIPILEARCRHFLNYPINREAASKSNRGHQHPDRIDYRPKTSLPMTGDADVPMAEDGNASNAGPSIPHSSIAPTASPSTKAYSAMTIPSGGSTPNVDGEVDELDSQDSDNLSIFL